MYCPLCKMTVTDGMGHSCTKTSAPIVISNPLDPLSASCEIESLRKKLADKALEIRLLHTAIDKSNEALEEAVKTKRKGIGYFFRSMQSGRLGSALSNPDASSRYQCWTR